MNIAQILYDHRNEPEDDLLAALNIGFERFCDEYTKDYDSIRKTAFTEMYCCLAQLVITCEDDATLLKDSLDDFLVTCLKNSKEK